MAASAMRGGAPINHLHWILQRCLYPLYGLLHEPFQILDEPI
jgi:hypothetical protein